MSVVKYTNDHEWVRVDGDEAVIGITDFAQGQLGDVVYVELPDIGRTFEKGKEAAVVESCKSANDVFSPLSGEVTAINTELAATPALVNSDPMGKGWFFKLRPSNLKELDPLLDEAAYRAMIGETK